MAKPAIKIENNKTTRHSERYICSGLTLQLPDHDSDIVLRLPSGEEVELQFRTEGAGLDVLLPENLAVTNWEGDDMMPAKQVGKQKHVLNAKQLFICLPENSFEKI